MNKKEQIFRKSFLYNEENICFLDSLSAVNIHGVNCNTLSFF